MHQRFFKSTDFYSTGVKLLATRDDEKERMEQEIAILRTNCEYLKNYLTCAQTVCHLARSYRDILDSEIAEASSLSAGLLLDEAITRWENLEQSMRQ